MFSPCGRETKPSWYFLLNASKHKVVREAWSIQRKPGQQQQCLSSPKKDFLLQIYKESEVLLMCLCSHVFLCCSFLSRMACSVLRVLVGWFPLTSSISEPLQSTEPTNLHQTQGVQRTLSTVVMAQQGWVGAEGISPSQQMEHLSLDEVFNLQRELALAWSTGLFCVIHPWGER